LIIPILALWALVLMLSCKY